MWFWTKDKDDLDKNENKLNGNNLENFVKLVPILWCFFFYLDTER